MTSATNPESGKITYAYTKSSGALCSGKSSSMCQKTTPKASQTGTATVTTTYVYDALNRLSSKSYNDGATATVQYGYDGTALTGCTTTPPSLTDSYPIPDRTSMCDASGATSWSHDKMGRIATEKRTIGSVVGKTSTHTYNFDGSIATMTTLGDEVAYTYGGAARPLTATNGGTTTYASAATYTAPGELAGLQLGSAITVSNTFQNRLQPSLLSASTSSKTLFSRSYAFNYGTIDNGNVVQIVNNVDNPPIRTTHMTP